MLMRLGCGSRITRTIMGCVTTLSFSFVLNGTVGGGSVTPERDICQGCLIRDAENEAMPLKVDMNKTLC